MHCGKDGDITRKGAALRHHRGFHLGFRSLDSTFRFFLVLSNKRNSLNIFSQARPLMLFRVAPMPSSSGNMELEDEKEEAKGMEEDILLVPLAPDASLPEEQQSASTDVSATPVFQWLDEWHFGDFMGKTNLTFGSLLAVSNRIA
ncbi:hypothetical protein D9C73_024835 [Collichthys lucidus]|uniref:Uncharacterized protein n=1 Tax=Collichthys lucidus TaxID=240159 RepID=A0A4V6XZ29_COLLU|nr:hypothetical protein D9C73_024835 [Collichthys lucidus]